jgi:hypothetical protein
MPATLINATVAAVEPADTTLVNSMALTQTCPVISNIVGPVLSEMQMIVPGLTVYAPSDEAADSAPPAIWWSPLDEEWTAPQRQGAPNAPGLLFVREIPIAFQLFGGVAPSGTWPDAELPLHACDLTEILASHLANVLQRRLSNMGYRFRSLTWFQPERTGIGAASVLQISIRMSLLREDNPTIHVTRANVEVSI